MSAKFLVECLFDLLDNGDSDDSLDGDCCLKDLANTQEQEQEQEQEQTKQMEMTSVDEEKIHEEKKEIIYHKKGVPNKTKQAQWTQIFSTEKKKKKKKSKVCFCYKGKKERRKRVSISED